jgi:hypothetical protein
MLLIALSSLLMRERLTQEVPMVRTMNRNEATALGRAGAALRIVALLACALGAVACSGAGDASADAWNVEAGGAPGEGGASGSDLEDVEMGTCNEGATHECRVYVELASGIPSCWKGTQTCVDGHWTKCKSASPKESTTDN